MPRRVRKSQAPASRLRYTLTAWNSTLGATVPSSFTARLLPTASSPIGRGYAGAEPCPIALAIGSRGRLASSRAEARTLNSLDLAWAPSLRSTPSCRGFSMMSARSWMAMASSCASSDAAGEILDRLGCVHGSPGRREAVPQLPPSIKSRLASACVLVSRGLLGGIVSAALEIACDRIGDQSKQAACGSATEGAFLARGGHLRRA